MAALPSSKGCCAGYALTALMDTCKHKNRKLDSAFGHKRQRRTADFCQSLQLARLPGTPLYTIQSSRKSLLV